MRVRIAYASKQYRCISLSVLNKVLQEVLLDLLRHLMLL